MESEEPRLLLEGVGDSFVIGADFWNDVIDWAMDRGWLSSDSGKFDRSDRGYEVSPEDAARFQSFHVVGPKKRVSSETQRASRTRHSCSTTPWLALGRFF